MKLLSPLLFCVFTAGVLDPIPARGEGAASTVRIEVRVLSEQDRKDLKGTAIDAVTQKKTLAIGLTGASKSPETRLGKWMVFGRNLKSDDVVLIDSGQFKVDLSQSGVQQLESKQVWTVSAREHASVGKKVGNAGRPKIKKVGATGTKYIGYGVEIRDGSQVVAKVFDPPSLAQQSH